MTPLPTLLAALRSGQRRIDTLGHEERACVLDAAERASDADAKVAFWEGVAERRVVSAQRARLRAALRLSVLEAERDAWRRRYEEHHGGTDENEATIATLRAQVEGLRERERRLGTHDESLVADLRKALAEANERADGREWRKAVHDEALLDSLLGAFDEIERDGDTLTIEVTGGGVVWWYGSEEAPEAQGSADGLRAAILEAADHANPKPRPEASIAERLARLEALAREDGRLA